jgi:hypothetical protein
MVLGTDLREVCRLNWVTVSREVFEYEMVPWIGRDYAAWLRASARPHPADEHHLVLVPERIYRVFNERDPDPGQRATAAQLEAMGYPRLPEEDELSEARREQVAAAAAGDTRRLAEVHQRIETLERQLEAARRAMETWRKLDPARLEEEVARELTNAPHADVLVGIPAEAHTI